MVSLSFFKFVSELKLFSSRSFNNSAISNNSFSSSAISNRRVNYDNFFFNSYSVVFNFSFSLSSFVTARSERNSCESYEHKC